MMRGKRQAPKKRLEWSKLVTLVVVIFGFIIAQECLVLMFYCIRNQYTATAAWLTAAIGIAEAIMGTGLAGYLSLCKSDHQAGGITYEAAKAKNFDEGNIDSPAI